MRQETVVPLRGEEAVAGFLGSIFRCAEGETGHAEAFLFVFSLPRRVQGSVGERSGDLAQLGSDQADTRNPPVKQVIDIILLSKVVHKVSASSELLQDGKLASDRPCRRHPTMPQR